MGKVQKKANEKHEASLSTAFRSFISQAASIPLVHLPAHLASIDDRWPYPRGDLYNWIPCLDRFDEILCNINTAYGLDKGPQIRPFGNLVLQEGKAALSPDLLASAGLNEHGDQTLLESILFFSRLLLEKCGNRTLYNSSDRLNDLLNTTSLPVLHKVLRLTLFLAQRHHDKSPHSHHFYHFDLDRLQRLTEPLLKLVRRPRSNSNKTPRLKRRITAQRLTEDRGSSSTAPSKGKTEDLFDDDATAGKEKVAVKVVYVPVQPQVEPPADTSRPELPTTPTPLRQQSLDVQMTSPTKSDVATAPFKHDKPNVGFIDLDTKDLRENTIEVILADAPADMPPASRYELLHKLRMAYAVLEGDESRIVCFRNRIVAVAVLSHVYPNEDEFMLKCFKHDSTATSRQQFIHQLIGTIRQPNNRSPDILYTRTLVAELLQILSHFRQFSNEILSLLAPNSSHGLMLSLIKEILADAVNDGDWTDTAIGDDWREATYNLFGVLQFHIESHAPRASDTVIHRNLVDSLTSAFSLMTEKAMRLHPRIIDFLAMFYHNFRDGMQLLITNGSLDAACSLFDKTANRALESVQMGHVFPPEFKPQSTDYQTGYLFHTDLKVLLGFINNVPNMQGNQADRALRSLVDSSTLQAGFKTVLVNASIFGSHIWSEVVKAISGFLNNEPTSYTVISEAGIIAALLQVVQPLNAGDLATASSRTISAASSYPVPQVPAVAEALTNLASAFSAICLTEAGHQNFVKTRVLENFLEIFESPEHVKVIKEKHTGAALGAAIDELVRHHPSLRPAVVSAVVVTIARVRHICQAKAWQIGSGPKLWLDTPSSEPIVDGGLPALLWPNFTTAAAHGPVCSRLILPNQDTLEIPSEPGKRPDDLENTARDIDANGLTAGNYAQAMLTFLSALLEGKYVSRDLMAAGAGDLLMDLVSTTTYGLSLDPARDGFQLGDLANTLKSMSEERPSLILPALLERLKTCYLSSLLALCSSSKPNNQSFFSKYLNPEEENKSMEIDSTASMSGTQIVKCLLQVSNLVTVISWLVSAPTFAARSSPTWVLNTINVHDLLSEAVEMMGKLSAACRHEEVLIACSLPRSWLAATKPGTTLPSEHDHDAILVPDETEPTRNGSNTTGVGGSNSTEFHDLTEDMKNTTVFRNLQTLRALVHMVPRAISKFMSSISLALNGKKRSESTWNRQKLKSTAQALAKAFVYQLEPPFLQDVTVGEGDSKEKEQHYNYLTLSLQRIRDSLNDGKKASGRATQVSFVIDQFRKFGGVRALTKIGTLFFNELSAVNPSPCSFSANIGLRTCLDLLSSFTQGEFAESSQAMFMKQTDPGRTPYFNPDQALLELRTESLPLARLIWDSEYAEHASTHILRCLANILKHTLKGEHEEAAFATADAYPKFPDVKPRKYVIDAGKSRALVDKGYSVDLVEEALFRVNADRHPSQAEEYCEVYRVNPNRPRLPPPFAEIERKPLEVPIHSQVPTFTPDRSQDGTFIASAPDQLAADLDILWGRAEQSVTSVSATTPQAVPETNVTSPMSLDRILNPTQNSDIMTETSAVTSQTTPTVALPSKEMIHACRESIRENIVERCNNILGAHDQLVWDLNDLLSAAAPKLPSGKEQAWWSMAVELLVSSLTSQDVASVSTESDGRKIAATAHLLGLICNNETHRYTIMRVILPWTDDLIEFLHIPMDKTSSQQQMSSPWIGKVLLILEKLLDLDAEFDKISYQPINDVNTELKVSREEEFAVSQSQKEALLLKIIDLLPRVDKDRSIAESVLRVLSILTRDHKLAQIQGQRRNLQKLFLMIKQMASALSAPLEGPFMLILRNIIEDETTIRQIMRSELVAYFSDRSTGRKPDMGTLMRDLHHLALRSPDIFVDVCKETIKFASWQLHDAPLVLRQDIQQSSKDVNNAKGQITEADDRTQEASIASIEQHQDQPTITDGKKDELKAPTVERPDGVVHFLLSELLSYKDVTDKEPTLKDVVKADDASIAGEIASTSAVQNATEQDAVATKMGKTRFKASDHPIFTYRRFLLHTLQELLYSYNQTKIEFINFSRKADPMATTPSKPRSGVLNYLLNAVVSSGFVDRDDSLDCRKRLALSHAAMRVIVALCSKTGEDGLSTQAASRSSPFSSQVDDRDTEPDLTFVRRFVLEHAIKAFKETSTSTEPQRSRYARLLCLAELFRLLITKPSVQDGFPAVPNNSYKRIARMMLEKNFIGLLTTAINDIDLCFPSARKVIKFILRPLQDLTTIALSLNTTSPDVLPALLSADASDNISSASSDISEEIDSDREETPDLYRNSALGMLDPEHQQEMEEESEEELDEDEDEEMYDQGYDDGMEFDNGALPPNDGEVVSDDEFDEVGPMEGMDGNEPMDIEFVVDHHDHDEDSEESSQTDSDGDDGEIEIEEDNGTHIEFASDEDPEEWEDADDDEEDDEDDDGEVDEEANEPGSIEIGEQSTVTALSNILRAAREQRDEDGVFLSGLPPTFAAAQEEPDLDDEDDDGEDRREDGDGDDGMDDDDEDEDEDDDPDGLFPHLDMMLENPDDALESYDWAGNPIHMAGRDARARHLWGHHVPGFFSRRTVLVSDDMHPDHYAPRHHRHNQPIRNTGEDGSNPLLRRPDQSHNRASHDLRVQSDRSAPLFLPNFSVMQPRIDEQGRMTVTLDPNNAGHGAVMDALMNHLQRHNQMPLDGMEINLHDDPRASESFRNIMAAAEPSGLRLDAFHNAFPPLGGARSARDDPVRGAYASPVLTMARWQEAARILFDKTMSDKTKYIQALLIAVLTPLAQQDEKERVRKAEEDRKAREEREAQEKLERAQKQKEEEEARLAKEIAEAEALMRVEAARQEAEGERVLTQSGGDQPDITADVMEGVESTDATQDVSATDAVERPRVFTTIRGSRIDITGLDIDPEYLEALPEDMREEVIQAQYHAHQEQAQEEGGNDTSTLDPDFLEALPPEMRLEIMQQEASIQRRRQREENRRQVQAQAVAAGVPQAAEIDNDDFLASLDPGLRRQILAEQTPEILATLNERHAAEGRAHQRILYERIPVQRGVDRGRVAATQAPRRPMVQLVDQAGVATLLRLMFIQQQGSLKSNLTLILNNICSNRQTRLEVINLLLVILKEGSADAAAVEKSLSNLSLRAKATTGSKTPQPLRRTLSTQVISPLTEETSPVLVVQQCVNALKAICERNVNVKIIFLREVDLSSNTRSKTKTKSKEKDTRSVKYPINDLISLLAREIVMGNAACLVDLAQLLALVTGPIGPLVRAEAQRKKADVEKVPEPSEGTTQASGEQSSSIPATQAPTDVSMQDEGDEAASNTRDPDSQVRPQESGVVDPEKKKEERPPFEPPAIQDENLRLIARIFVAPECGASTFRSTLETIRSLSYIPGASSILGQELTGHVQRLAGSICADLDELLPAIRDAESTIDVSDLAAAKFSSSTSNQVKLLRVLTAMQNLPVQSMPEDDDKKEPVSILKESYKNLRLAPLWTKLSDCLNCVEEKGDTISFANILLPLIESLMVVCEGTALKDSPSVAQGQAATVVSPTYSETDDLEALFYSFTTEHRKILNDIVRQTPKLMQGPMGSFKILVKNSKVLDFDNKRNYFNKQMHSRNQQHRGPHSPLHLNVRREQVFGDSYKALYYKTAEEMKYGKLNIRFNGEEGVDAGGVTREWFHVLARGIFDPNYALFQPVASDKTTFHPNMHSSINPDHLLYFKFIGRIIGKALHENRVLDCHFSRALYKRMLGKSPNLKDLESMDVDYYKSLVWILENDITDIISEEFCVIEDEFGEEKIVDLIPDGRNVPVTDENKKEYVQKLVEYRLTTSVQSQLDNFLQGFHDIIPAELISIFNEQELELLISGLPEIDVDDWKANTEYHNYNPASQQIVWFWRIVRAMSNEERAKLLQFITGTSKVPLNGFKELEGVSGLTKCNIHKDPNTERLPTSHTCFNQLDLPPYETFELMKHNLSIAVNLGADYFGFA